MDTRKNIAFVVIWLMLLNSSSLFAGSAAPSTVRMAPPVTVVNTGETNTGTDSGDDYIPPTSTNITYSFDQSKIKIENSQLYKVNCVTNDIGQEYGITGFGSKITAFEYKEGNLNIRVDGTNCNVSGWSNYVMPTDIAPTTSPGVTEAQAIAKAKAFLSNFSFAKNLPALWDPIVTGRNVDYPMMDYRDGPTSSTSTNTDTTTGSTAQTGSTDVTPSVDKKYQYLSVVFPILINKQPTYGQYGEPAGFTVSIDGKGEVTNFNGTMKFTLQRKRSDVLTTDSMISFIKKGGNNPYYGIDNTKKTITLDNISRGYIFFPLYRGNTTENYISTGYILKSSTTKIPYSGNNYTQTNSDYYIGNNQAQIFEKQG